MRTAEIQCSIIQNVAANFSLNIKLRSQVLEYKKKKSYKHSRLLVH